MDDGMTRDSVSYSQGSTIVAIQRPSFLGTAAILAFSFANYLTASYSPAGDFSKG